MRALVAWLIGCSILLLEPLPNFDIRFKARGTQPHSQQIVLIQISQSEWVNFIGQKRNWIRPLKETTYLSDSFYWNPYAWEKILKKLENESPLAIAPTFFFGDNIRRPPQYILNSPIFKNNQVYWSSRVDDEGRLLSPRFEDQYIANVGIQKIQLADDGVVRAHIQVPSQKQDITDILARKLNPNAGTSFTRLINYKGQKHTYHTISLSDFINNNYQPNLLKDKIILIGSSDSEGHVFNTPVGLLSRSEILATMIDNLANEQYIKRFNTINYFAILFLIMFVTVWVMSIYPHSVAFVLLSFFSAFWTVFSMWMFDTYFIWLPISAALAIIISGFIIFMSFQLTVKDYMNSQLEKEKEFLLEVEQIKNNFVSLISHDLKTPIAKIQAICDRLLSQKDVDEELSQDLKNLRREGTELHRYIRTILQITKVESRNFKLRLDSTDMNEVVEAVSSHMRPLAKEKDISIDLKLEPMFLVEVDSTLVFEVILNLLSNAIKYTQPGGNVKVTTEEINNQIYVSVIDNGPGISEDEQLQIFDKFFRGQQAKQQPKGSGLGLYLVKYFIELHNGKVFLESELGKGTKVGFSLPLDNEASSDEAEDYSGISQRGIL